MLWRSVLILLAWLAFGLDARGEDAAANLRGQEERMVYLLAALGGAIFIAGAWALLVRVRARTEAIRKHEASLEERFRDLYENANDIIYTHDLEGRITSMSNAGLALFGYTREEMVGMNISRILDPADLENARRHTAEKLHGTPRTTYELRLRARDGRLLYFDVNSRLIFKDGAPVGVQGISRDITERREAEEALRVSERQLRAAFHERERLGRDLHDGIIQSIYAVGLNLEDSGHLIRADPPAAEERVRKLTADLNQVIREVRSFIMGLERHPVKGEDFKAALKALTLIAPDRRASQVELLIDQNAATELSQDEATQLLQIAREALSNSIRHGNAEKLVFALRKSDDGVIFELSDNGVGFDPAASRSKGFGLRNMAARAAEIDAVFQIVSQPGEGTRIVLDMRRPTTERLGS